MSRFTYIDDIRHCWRTKEPQVCVICGQHSAVYPFIVDHEEGYDKFCVCDVCLRSGRLAERNLRVNSGDVRSLIQQIGQIQPELGSDERTRLALERTAEVEQRTPRPNYANLFVWPFHCGDYAVFLHRAESQALSELAPDADGYSFFATHFHTDYADLEGEILKAHWENELRGFYIFYLWRCRQCGEYLITFTSD